MRRLSPRCFLSSFRCGDVGPPRSVLSATRNVTVWKRAQHKSTIPGDWGTSQYLPPPHHRHHRLFHATASVLSSDPYKVLSVPTTATEKEIKIAYFKLAKRFHPDVNKSEEAKTKFQAAANAYEVLSDPKKRAAYDNSGFDPFGSAGYQQQQQQQQQQRANAQQHWSNVTLDADIIEEALREYGEEVAENAAAAAAGVGRGDIQPLWGFVKRHKGIVASIVLPTLLIFRFPGAVVGVMRFIPQIASIALGVVVYSSRILGARGSFYLIQAVWKNLWPLLVSEMQGSVKYAAKHAAAYTAARRAAKTSTKAKRGERTSAQEEAQRKSDERRNGQQRKGKGKGAGRRSRKI